MTHVMVERSAQSCGYTSSRSSGRVKIAGVLHIDVQLRMPDKHIFKQNRVASRESSPGKDRFQGVNQRGSIALCGESEVRLECRIVRRHAAALGGDFLHRPEVFGVKLAPQLFRRRLARLEEERAGMNRSGAACMRR